MQLPTEGPQTVLTLLREGGTAGLCAFSRRLQADARLATGLLHHSSMVSATCLGSVVGKKVWHASGGSRDRAAGSPTLPVSSFNTGQLCVLHLSPPTPHSRKVPGSLRVSGNPALWLLGKQPGAST